MTRARRAPVALAVVAVVLAAAIVASCLVGAVQVPLGTFVAAVARAIRGDDLVGTDRILVDIRLPRVLVGAVVGAGLGAAGAGMQAVFRNPLADPYLLGAAGGATLGVTVAVVASGAHRADNDLGALVPEAAAGTVPLFAFAGALGAVLFTLSLARARGRASPASLLLSGVVVGSIAISVSTFLMLRDGEHLRAVLSWTLGNLSLAGWSELARLTPWLLAGVAALWALGRGLDALQLGEDTARTLGVHADRVRFAAVVAASLATGASVAFVGTIGFVGLVAPHVMRRLAAPTHRVLVPASALLGAALLVVADMGARVLARPAELPVGVVLTLAGGPFFLWLLRKP